MENVANKLNAIIKLQKALTNHDWHYQRSDDPGVYRRGTQQKNDLNILMTDIGDSDLALSLYNKACPWVENIIEVTPNRYSLLEQAQELIESGNSKESSEGRGMMTVINAIMDAIEYESDSSEEPMSDGECIDEIYAIINTNV